MNTAWELPDYHWEREPEFVCMECFNDGFVADGDRAEPCPSCSGPCDLGDAYERTDIDFIFTAKEH